MNGLRYGSLALALTGAAVIAACGLGDPAGPSAGKTSAPVPSSPAPPGPGAAAACVACQDLPLGESPHAYRLSNAQYEATLSDLLGFQADPKVFRDLPTDPVAAGVSFGVDATALDMSSQRWVVWQTIAETLAAQVTGDALTLNNILPVAAQSGTDVPTRMNAFLTVFLPRAYRRPVTSQEIASVISAAETAASQVSSGDPFVARVQWAVASILQSPQFLYHIRYGVDQVVNGRARLAPYELAEKLSYGLWNTMPDDGVTAHAANGDLATNDGLAKVAQEMLNDDRASDALVRFHELLYLTDSYTDPVLGLVDGSRPAATFSTYYPQFGQDAAEDIRRSVQQITVTNKGSVRDLFTSDVAFVNSRLAPTYGIDPATIPALASNPDPANWTQIHMDPAQRHGILTHPGWLAYEGTPTDPSTIHRGVYLARQITCQQLGNPPAAANGKDPSQAPGNTNRDRVAAITAGCGDGCHGGVGGIINPMGFALEEYDSVGKFRTNDRGFPLNLASTTTLLGDFDGAKDFFQKVSDSDRAHACYVAHWSAFLNTKATVDVQPSFLAPALATSLANGSVRDVITELVQTDAFTTVSR